MTDAGRERLNKVLAHAGVASRRRADDLIAAGRVTVNDVVARDLGTTVDPTTDRVAVDGAPIAAERPEHWALHKPLDVLTAVSDDRGRPVARALVPTRARVYPVGRLDASSTGLVLFTNDGELAHRLMHPSHAHAKRYEVLVSGYPNEATLERLRAGIALEDGPTLPATVRALRTTKGAAWLAITLREGRKRQIRRMMEAVDHPVVHLRRVAIGPLTLGRLREGEARPLAAREIAALYRLVGLARPAGAGARGDDAPAGGPSRRPEARRSARGAGAGGGRAPGGRGRASGPRSPGARRGGGRRGG